MTAKEYLLQYREAMRRVQAITEHLSELRAIAERITPNYSSSGGNHQAGDKIGSAVAKIVDAEVKTTAEIDQLTALEAEIISVIDRVQEPYRTLLYERYVNGLTFERIAVRMNYSWRQIIRLHGQALQYAQDVIVCHI